MKYSSESQETQKSIRVKFMSRALPEWKDRGQFIRHFPGSVPRWGNCEFTMDVNCNEYDWLVVYHDLPKNGNRLIETKVHCPREQTILITPEPSSITVYGQDYFNQFGTIITFQEPWAVKHHNAVFRYPGLIWFYGYSIDDGTYTTYNELKQEEPHKSLMISAMCSSRSGNVTLHSRRVDFIKRIQQDVPELEVYGHGVRPINDKAEALRPYRFHIVIENHLADHHITEKLPDALLGYCLTFYHGAPNADEYFPEESFIPIDINDYSKSLDIIRSHLSNKEYLDRLPYIREARRRVLEEHNLFSIINQEINRQAKTITSATYGCVIRNRPTMRIKNPVAGVRSLSEKAYVKMRHRLNQFNF
jgi:hypothetical protein